MKAAYGRLLWKEVRQAAPAALGVVLAVILWDTFLWSRVQLWFGPKAALVLAVSPVALLPLWAAFRLVRSLRRDFTGPHAQFVLTLPVPGWSLTGVKLLVVGAETVLHGLVVAAGWVVLARAMGGADWVASIPAALMPPIRQAVIRSGLSALLMALGGLAAWLVIVQLAWIVGRLFRRGHRLVSLAALVSAGWLVMRAGTVGPALLGWLPRWTPFVWPDITVAINGPADVTFYALTLHPAPFVAMGLTVIACAGIAAWLLERHLEV